MKSILRSLLLVGLSVMLNACAFDVVRINQLPVELQTDSNCVEEFSLTEDTSVKAGPGYNRILKSGTRWVCIGEILQGKVYKTKDQILTVEASNVFEAYLVVDDQKLIGYYLPVEGSFYPLKDHIRLPTNQL